MFRVRYRQGIVGETQRVVHLARKLPPGDVLRALCGRDLPATDTESCDDGGMPCMQCTARAAIASQPDQANATTAANAATPIRGQGNRGDAEQITIGED